MEQRKQLYETTYIINGALEDAAIEAAIAKVQDIITRHGGEIVTHTRWGRKRFAYPIKHKNNGFYAICEYHASPTFIKEFEHFFRLDESILRHLTIAISKLMLKARALKPLVLEIAPLTQEIITQEIIKEELQEAKEELHTPIEVGVHPHTTPEGVIK
ncbi:MAG: 30S ribosomal protein S6 [Ignavibacteriales bacterium]|nr:30S ribosomal protein S6 [Ignavibacteriales bacterium]